MAWLLDQCRQYQIIFRSKADDVRYPDARTIRTAEGMDDQRYSRFVLNPRPRRRFGAVASARDLRVAQYAEFRAAFDRIFAQGGWTAYLDEVFYLTETLRLGVEIETLLTQGRSLGISVAGGIQRPVRITRFLLTESRHILSFRLEGRDAKEFADSTHEMVRREVTTLPEHHFLWFRRPDRLWKGRLDMHEGRLVGEYVT